MSGKAVGWVLDWAEKTNPLALLLLIAIADAAHNDGTGCSESSATLAGRIGVSDRQVRRLNQVLVDRGDVIMTTSRGRHPNTYTITLRNSRGESLVDDDRRARELYATRTHGPGSTRTEPGPNPDRTRTEPGKVEHKVNVDPNPDPDPYEDVGCVSRARDGSEQVNTPAVCSLPDLPDRPSEEAWANFRDVFGPSLDAPTLSPREAYFQGFCTEFAGTVGPLRDPVEAEREWNANVAPGQEQACILHLRNYAASDEVIVRRRPMGAAKWLRQWPQWVDIRHDAPVGQARAPNKPDYSGITNWLEHMKSQGVTP